MRSFTVLGSGTVWKITRRGVPLGYGSGCRMAAPVRQTSRPSCRAVCSSVA